VGVGVEKGEDGHFGEQRKEKKGKSTVTVVTRL
jgi:hypothetical protein